MATERRFVEMDGFRIEVLVDGAGPAIILLPSLGRDASDFDEIAPALSARGFKTIRPQPRGMGGSNGPLDGLSMSDIVDDVVAVIRSEADGPVIVAGHAFGNFVVRMIAEKHPELVRGVAILAGSAGMTSDGNSPFDPQVRESIMKSSDLSLSDDERIEHLKRAFFSPTNDPSVWLTGWNPVVKAAQRKALDAEPLESWFAAGSAPILELQAFDDTVANRKNAHVLKEKLGDRVRVVVVENAGHALLPEQPKAVIDTLADWASSL